MAVYSNFPVLRRSRICELLMKLFYERLFVLEYSWGHVRYATN